MNKVTQFLRPLMPILAAAYRRAARRPFVKRTCRAARAGSRRAVFQADGHLPLPPSRCTDRRLRGDGLPVRNTPRAQLPGGFHQRPVLRDGVYLVAKHLV